MKIYLDFDGTIVEHQYPKMGKPNFGCIEVIKKLQDAGHEIILNSYRADCNDGTLEEAQKLLNEQYLKLLKNPELIDHFRIEPITKFARNKLIPSKWDMELFKTKNLMFIDDKSAGIPLKKAVWSHGLMVDWDVIDAQFLEHGMYEMTLDIAAKY